VMCVFSPAQAHKNDSMESNDKGRCPSAIPFLKTPVSFTALADFEASFVSSEVCSTKHDVLEIGFARWEADKVWDKPSDD
jgi:hypothetical protein